MDQAGGYNKELSELLGHLWRLDKNKCRHGKDYLLNIQKNVSGGSGKSNKKLFEKFDENILKRPTYQTFVALLDNYEADLSREEVETREERTEEERFLSAIMETEVMKEAYRFLRKKGKCPDGLAAFKNQLYDIWFELYKRTRDDRVVNSCGFEHVFVGEIRGEEVLGFHNWISLYLQEKRKEVEYCGFFDHDLSENGLFNMMTLQFKWRGVLKHRSGSFFGTSPELEIALYTVAFLCKHPNRPLKVKICGFPLELHVYEHGSGIGSAYPDFQCD